MQPPYMLYNLVTIQCYQKIFLGTCGCHDSLMKIRWHGTRIVLRFSFVLLVLYFPEKAGVCCVDKAEIEKWQVML